MKHRLSLMTVFLPRENLFFLEEWLRYHIAVGFDHFYLYDNGGSRWLDCGNSLEVTSRNKRGEAIGGLLADRSDAEVQVALDRVLAPFAERGYLTRIPWRPRDAAGQVTFGQSLAFMDYIRRFGSDTEWVAFTDIDEFIVPVRHPSIREVLTEAERDQVTFLVLPQKCFASRFGADDRPFERVVEINACADWVTADFGRKALIRADTLRVPWRKQKYSIHSPDVSKRRTRRLLDPGLIRFNHYKFNRWELDWVAQHLGRPIELDQVDTGLLRFADRMAAALFERRTTTAP